MCVCVCVCVCARAHVCFPHYHAIPHQLDILQFNSILTLSLWRQYQIPQVEGSVPQDYSLFQPISDASQVQSPVLLIHQLYTKGFPLCSPKISAEMAVRCKGLKSDSWQVKPSDGKWEMKEDTAGKASALGRPLPIHCGAQHKNCCQRTLRNMVVPSL